jgi:hypothetical protein
MKSYRERIADNLLKDELEGVGAVLIEGPKWCGKTTTAEQQAKSVVYLNDPAVEKELMAVVDTDIKLLLKGATPRLIDEWQSAPTLWDAIRFEVDHRDTSVGQFILTGSAVPAQTDQIHHSGAGRFSWLTMRPMSLWESQESSGVVSLRDLFKGLQPSAIARNIEIEDLAFMACRGGWPAAVTMGNKAALKQAYNYIDAICNTDISRVDGTKREPAFCKRLLRSYARNLGSQAPLSTLYADIATNDGSSISENTIASYLQALKKIFVIEDMPAWNPNLRSKSAIRTSDTRYFVDPSMAVAALGLGPDDLVSDLNTFGFIFETMAVRDLRVYAQALDGNVFHFRDRNGLECDAVVHLRNGSYGLIEIKLGGDKNIEEGAKALNQLSKKIDTDKMKSPSFKMVLTGLGQYAYTRKDGVIVTPIGALKN